MKCIFSIITLLFAMSFSVSANTFKGDLDSLIITPGGGGNGGWIKAPNTAPVYYYVDNDANTLTIICSERGELYVILVNQITGATIEDSFYKTVTLYPLDPGYYSIWLVAPSDRTYTFQLLIE